jgi:hypothetical protein
MSSRLGPSSQWRAAPAAAVAGRAADLVAGLAARPMRDRPASVAVNSANSVAAPKPARSLRVAGPSQGRSTEWAMRRAAAPEPGVAAVPTRVRSVLVARRVPDPVRPAPPAAVPRPGHSELVGGRATGSEVARVVAPRPGHPVALTAARLARRRDRRVAPMGRRVLRRPIRPTSRSCLSPHRATSLRPCPSRMVVGREASPQGAGAGFDSGKRR